MNGSDGASVWWREYYVHGLGPLLQWIDAFLILGCFRYLGRTAVALISVFLAYVVWIELALRPNSDAPVGTVTSGLPYPFLNDMVMSERAMFYLTTAITGFVFLAICAALAFGLRRLLGLGVAR